MPLGAQAAENRDSIANETKTLTGPESAREKATWPSASPPPWTVQANPDCYWIEDANGHRLAFVYFRYTASIGSQSGLMSQDSARRIAANIAKLPELIK